MSNDFSGADKFFPSGRELSFFKPQKPRQLLLPAFLTLMSISTLLPCTQRWTTLRTHHAFQLDKLTRQHQVNYSFIATVFNLIPPAPKSIMLPHSPATASLNYTDSLIDNPIMLPPAQKHLLQWSTTQLLPTCRTIFLFTPFTLPWISVFPPSTI